MKPTALLLFCVAVVGAGAKSPKIAGGQDAAPGQFPWLVSIEATNFEEGWHLCGGVLIDPQWVLTAAHCIETEKPEWLRVITGNLDTEVDEGTEQYIRVNRLVMHPDYIHYERPYVNDVGLIRLSAPATLDDYTQVALLPVNSDLELAEPCMEAGWGETAAGGGGSSILQWAMISLLTQEDCEGAYSSTPDPNSICAGTLGGGVGACVGDNGGGLTCWDSISMEYVMCGIMSWREGCAELGKPAVYMDVASYKDWIFSQIG